MQYEEGYSKMMEGLFEEGMKQGLIRQGSAPVMMMSFRSLREGLLNWMIVLPDVKPEIIKQVWDDFWLGVSKREG